MLPPYSQRTRYSDRPLPVLAGLQCNYQYNVQRTRWAQILEDTRLVRAFAALLLLLATGLAACLLAPLGAASRFFSFVAFNPRSPYQAGAVVASLWGWRLDALVSGLLGIAICGVGVAIRDAYQGAHPLNSLPISLRCRIPTCARHHRYHSAFLPLLSCLLGSPPPHDPHMGREVALRDRQQRRAHLPRVCAFGCVVAARQAHKMSSELSKTLLTKWGTMILEVHR